MPFTRNLITYFPALPADGATVGNYPLARTHTADLPPFIPLVAAVRTGQPVNVLTPPTINVGFNPPTFNNLISGRQLGGLLGVTQLALDAGAAAVPDDTLIVVRVAVAAVPTPGNVATFNFRVVLLGYDVEF